ncbi:MAG: hypothetical protein Q9174_003808 [Haloplaca sp. 1 TL-2023]
MRQLPPHLVPRNARTDFSWIFWDPTGEKRRRYERERENTFLKHVPRWMRSSAFGSVNADVRASPDVEAGVVQGPAMESGQSSSRGHPNTLSCLGRHWNVNLRHASRTSRPPDLESGNHTNLRCSSETRATSITLADHNASQEVLTSVRMRKTTRRSSSSDDWQRGSDIIERATRTDLFTSRAACNLINLFDPHGRVGEVYEVRPLRETPRRSRGLERSSEQTCISDGSNRATTSVTTVDGEEEDGGDEPSASVCVRTPTRRSSSDWICGGEVIERAARTDLFTSQAACNLANLFDPQGTENAASRMPKPLSPKRRRCLEQSLEQTPKRLRRLGKSSEQMRVSYGSSRATSVTTLDDDGRVGDVGLRVEKKRRKRGAENAENGAGDLQEEDVSYGERQRMEDLATAMEDRIGSGNGSGEGSDKGSSINEGRECG